MEKLHRRQCFKEQEEKPTQTSGFQEPVDICYLTWSPSQKSLVMARSRLQVGKRNPFGETQLFHSIIYQIFGFAKEIVPPSSQEISFYLLKRTRKHIYSPHSSPK